MLLHKTRLMELQYEPKTDVLWVVWPDLEQARPEVIEENFRHIREAAKNYFIKGFLLDARQTTLVPDLDLFRKVVAQFFQYLEGTTIKRVARLQSPKLEREILAGVVADLLLPSEHPNIELKTFTKEKEAIAWLRGH